jgi:hypothetical protein
MFVIVFRIAPVNLKPVHVRWSEQATSTHQQLAQYFMVFLNDH